MMKKNSLLLFFICLFLVECHVITFKNTNANTSNVKTHSKWHHLVILDLIEVSDPVNLKRECAAGNWTSVQTQKSFWNIISGAVINFIAPIWYPQTVTITCENTN